MAITDLPGAFPPGPARWLVAVAIGGACGAAVGLLRLTLTGLMPGVAPFAFVYPGVMLATLMGGWLAGLVTAALTISFAWFWLMAPASTAAITQPQPTLIVVITAATLTLVVAELFRRLVNAAAAERDRQIAERDLFLAEFEHRVKNNFATVASLLELQRRRADPAAAEALSAALNRVESIARAHRYLYRGPAGPGTVEMRDYLGDLCKALGMALTLGNRITLDCQSDSAALPRDRAVSIGLIVNELVTNAAKHAFVGRDNGRIAVSFRLIADGWTLSVSDDGIGMASTQSGDAAPEGGLGIRLIDAFARQAGGTMAFASDSTGTRAVLTVAG
ncbi:sensor histidine kinase [Sphingomonas sp.]|uniref:sensor histidine kinase n=1 Tax=Sphingomonas sp. TaxID=28214 RepID=UPI001D25E15A|nr:sensor histidine kinase [Sphingomonas sp.]MBX9796599.1 sensor histidine kinase [Sphingomonas sp.]